MDEVTRRMFLMTMSLPVAASGRPSVLVLCTGNSARSQMAEGFLRSFDARLAVHSAGTEPAPRVNPYAVRAMQEIGIDISAGRPKHVGQFLDRPYDFVVTVCGEADESCPNFRGKVGKRLHIGFPDPAKATGSDEQIMRVFREVRDDIERRFREFYQKELRPKLG
jgi:arsenate reductase (thioredoxin)